MKDTEQKFSKTTIILHWLVALAMISLIAVGTYMEQTETYALYPIHKSFGILIIIAVLLRVVWRMLNGWPKPVGEVKKVEQLAAKVVHWVLIIGTVLFPISGMMMSGAGGRGLYVFGVELLAKNTDPVTGKVAPLNETLAGLGYEMHGILMWVMIAAIALHIIGAYKHHLVYKDNTLKRMLGKG